jgi:hypothetical protein
MHWGRRMIRKLDHLPVSPWEIQAPAKAPSFLQLLNHSWILHMRGNVLRKLKPKPRNKITVLPMNIHLHPSMSCPYLGRSSWYLYHFQLWTSLNLDLFLRGHSLLAHISPLHLILLGLMLTQLNLWQSMHLNQLVPIHL